MHFLVKWKGLGYDDVTWESEQDLMPKFAAEIARFEGLHPIIAEHADWKKQKAQVMKDSHSANPLHQLSAMSSTSQHPKAHYT